MSANIFSRLRCPVSDEMLDDPHLREYTEPEHDDERDEEEEGDE